MSSRLCLVNTMLFPAKMVGQVKRSTREQLDLAFVIEL